MTLQECRKTNPGFLSTRCMALQLLATPATLHNRKYNQCPLCSRLCGRWSQSSALCACASRYTPSGFQSKWQTFCMRRTRRRMCCSHRCPSIGERTASRPWAARWLEDPGQRGQQGSCLEHSRRHYPDAPTEQPSTRAGRAGPARPA